LSVLIGADCNALINSCFDFGFWILDNITNSPDHLTQRSQVAQNHDLNASDSGFGSTATSYSVTIHRR
jgi:hypothetical protein